MRMLSTPLLANFVQACDNYKKTITHTEERFNHNAKEAGEGVILLIIILLMLLSIGIWIWNLVVLIKYKDQLSSTQLTTCVLFTILSIATSMPFHIISLIIIYSSIKK